MIRDVDFVSYLPPFMQAYKEPVAALEAENSEFQIIWKATDRVFYNRFISTADEYGIARFEKMLGIHPLEEDTLEKRRRRIQMRWDNRIPYTIRNLAEQVKDILGSDGFAITIKNYMLSLTVYGLDNERKEELEYILSVMVPLDMVINIVYESPVTGIIYSGAVLYEADIIELKQRRI